MSRSDSIKNDDVPEPELEVVPLEGPLLVQRLYLLPVEKVKTRERKEMCSAFLLFNPSLYRKVDKKNIYIKVQLRMRIVGYEEHLIIYTYIF